MKKRRHLLFLIALTILLSCKSEKEKKIDETNKRSAEMFDSAIADISQTSFRINTDSIRTIYNKFVADSSELGLEYATKIHDFAKLVTNRSRAIKDSLDKIEIARNAKEEAIEQKKWDNSKAGKIQKKHPDWSKEDCEKIADREIWIGMSYEMLKYERGLPNSANPSNYGNGTEWQWCWDDYSPSCFYAGEDLIIKSYN